MHKCIRIKRKQSEVFMTPETSNGNKLTKQIYCNTEKMNCALGANPNFLIYIYLFSTQKKIEFSSLPFTHSLTI